ncbi:MAG: hypothetical protein A3H35_11605 [Betaproteobacteria bacterium RIFCSPLOWO2_02_FULL_62_17]|nr:MAG: hypothetical protein A3H35_11605 [Betaproteobacteria bacterium RIFCSPLOWO2_02_FULL_62_17]
MDVEIMKFTLTLSRWHKVAERTNAALKECEARVKAAYTNTTVSSWNKDGVEEKAADIARRAAQDLMLVEAGTRAVETIRATLAIRNAELGIAGRLAQVEGAKRRASLYKAVIEGQKPDMVRAQSVQNLPEQVNQSDWLSRRSALVVTLQTADRDLLEDLREKFSLEQSRAVRALDEIADLNRERIEIEVPKEVIEIARLAA